MSAVPDTSVRETVVRLWQLLDRPARRGAAVLFVFGLANMLMEMAAALAVVVALFHFNDPGFSVYRYEKLRFLSGWFPENSIRLPQLIGFILAAYLVKNALRVGEFYLREQLAERIGAACSLRLFRSYLDAPFLLFAERTTAELIDTVWHTADKALRSSLSSVLSLVSDGLVALAIFLVLLKSSPAPALAFAVGLGALGTAAIAFMHEHFGKIGHRLRRRHVATFHILQQAFQGIREVKLFQREGFFYERFRAARSTLVRLYVHDGVYRVLPHLVLEMIFIASFALMGLYAYYRADRDILLPIVGVYAFCGVRLLPSCFRLLTAVNQIRADGPILAYVQRELARPPAVSDRSAATELDPPLAVAADGLTFSYPGSPRPQVCGVTFRLEPGRSYAIVGESGSGKTTLLHLIAGLLTPDSGTLTVNGRPLDDVLRAWQKHVSYVAQEPFTLGDTLGEDITLGDEPPRSDRLRAVLRQARLDDWIATLPEGLRTPLGDQGIRISGGQRQRLAIARALYKRPCILLFDEPTSSLDTRTERAIEEALLELPGKITRVIITHRLSTARRCDQILYLDDGRLLGQASYEDLLRTLPAFRAFTEGGLPSARAAHPAI